MCCQKRLWARTIHSVVVSPGDVLGSVQDFVGLFVFLSTCLTLCVYSNSLLVTPEKNCGDLKMSFSLIGIAYVVNNDGISTRSSLFGERFTCSLCYVFPVVSRFRPSPRSLTYLRFSWSFAFHRQCCLPVFVFLSSVLLCSVWFKPQTEERRKYCTTLMGEYFASANNSE